MGCVFSAGCLGLGVERRGDHIVAIPGTTKLANLEINLGALDCRLTDEDRGVLNNLAEQGSGVAKGSS